MAVLVLLITLSVMTTACIALACLICLTWQAKKMSAATNYQSQIGGNSSYPTFPLAPSAFSTPPRQDGSGGQPVFVISNERAAVNPDTRIADNKLTDLPPSYEEVVLNL